MATLSPDVSYDVAQDSEHAKPSITLDMVVCPLLRIGA